MYVLSIAPWNHSVARRRWQAASRHRTTRRRRRIRGRARHEGNGWKYKGENGTESRRKWLPVSRYVASRCVFRLSVPYVSDMYWPTARGASRRRTALQAREAPRRLPPRPFPFQAATTRQPLCATPSAAATMRLRYHPRRVLSPACPRGGVVPPPTVTWRTLRGPILIYTCLLEPERDDGLV